MASKRSSKHDSRQGAAPRAARGGPVATRRPGSPSLLPVLALLGAMALAGIAGLLIRSQRANFPVDPAAQPRDEG